MHLLHVSLFKLDIITMVDENNSKSWAQRANEFKSQASVNVEAEKKLEALTDEMSTVRKQLKTKVRINEW